MGRGLRRDHGTVEVAANSQVAGANSNSFYCHCDSLEDLAHKAFRDNAESEVG